MNEAILRMLERYDCRTIDEYARALREILQETALLGLWRARFFERAAFYGGTALRILYGLDRFSEDLDFTLLKSDSGLSFLYFQILEREIRSFGFDVSMSGKEKSVETHIQLWVDNKVGNRHLSRGARFRKDCSEVKLGTGTVACPEKTAL